jgi:hypothetical protein
LLEGLIVNLAKSVFLALRRTVFLEDQAATLIVPLLTVLIPTVLSVALPELSFPLSSVPLSSTKKVTAFEFSSSA